MKIRINIFLFAAHHASENIAAQRFRSLINYLDPAIYHIHVFTRMPDVGLHGGFVSNTPNVSVHVLGGQCVGRHTLPFVTIAVFLSAFFTKLPYAIAWFRKFIKLDSCWMINALILADTICQSRLSQDEKCFVIGTYSPIDALVASRCLANKFSLPNLQDFRDGFVFESLGRQGKMASWLRSRIEKRVAQSATLITSVSSALVEDFRCRYGKLRVELLPNGYDPAEFTFLDNSQLSPEAQNIISNVPQGKVVIGHFGRVSDSDYSRFSAFEFFIKALGMEEQWLDKIHLIFVGKLTPVEENLLKTVRCSKFISPTVDRRLAQELMGQCNTLLLITGNRVCCATGKLFEYMATGRDIVCFSLVWNEAAKILESTASGRTILVGDDKGASAFFHDITMARHENFVRENDISAYSRKNQAAMLGDWILKECQ